MKERIGHLVGGAVEGMPWLGTFHSIGVQDPAPPRRAGRPQVGLHHPRHRRPDPPHQAGDRERGARQGPLAGAPARRPDRRLEEPRPDAGQGAARARPSPSPRARARALYARLSEAAQGAQRHRLRRPAARRCCACSCRTRTCSPTTSAASATSWSTSTRTPTSPSICGCGCSRGGSPNICCVGDDDQSIYGWRGAEVDNILRFEKDFPGAKVIRLERNYRSTGHILAAASGLIAHNKGRLGKTLLHRRRHGPAGGRDRRVGRRGGGARHRRGHRGACKKAGTRLNDMAILVRASFQMRAFEDRFVTLGLPYRVIGGPRFYERQEIKDAIAYLEVTLNPANDLKFERIVNVPKRGLGDTAVQAASASCAAGALGPALPGRPRDRGDGGADAAAARKSLRRPRRRLRALARPDRQHEAHRACRADPRRDAATRRCGRTTRARRRSRRLENLKELIRFMDEFESLQGFLEHVSLVMDADTQDGERPRLADDAARRQGAGVRRGVPARLGGGAVPAPAQPRRERPGGPRGGAPPRLRRPHARAPAGQGQLRAEPAQPRPVAGGVAVALRRRAARGQRRGDRAQEPLWRLGRRRGPVQPLRPQPLRRARRRLPERLHDARLAARQGAQQPRGPRRHGQAARARDAGWRARRLLGAASRPMPWASACSTRSSATAKSPRSTATSSPSISTRPAASASSTASSPTPARLSCVATPMDGSALLCGDSPSLPFVSFQLLVPRWRRIQGRASAAICAARCSASSPTPNRNADFHL